MARRVLFPSRNRIFALWSGATLICLLSLTACDGGRTSAPSNAPAVPTDPVAPPRSGADTTSPTLNITNPSGAITVNTSTINVTGTASDNVGVTAVSWRNDRGGNGGATGTGNWSASIVLQSGTNVISVVANDAANNVSATRSVTVTYQTPEPATFTASIAWPPNSDNPGGYSVYVGASTEDAANLAATLAQGGNWDLAAPSVDILSSTLRPLLGTGTQACFTVKAFNGAGSSAASPVTCVAVP